MTKMNKILVEIYIPASEKTYDLFIPSHLMMYDVLKMLCKMATEMCDGLFVSDENTIICNRADGSILNINLSVKELELKNGSKLMLI